MDFLTQHIIPPTAQHMKLLEFLAVVTYVIHLPYIAMVMGSTAVSMWLTFSDHELPNPRFARLAGDLIDTVLGNRFTMLVLSIMPLFVLPFVWQWFVCSQTVPLKVPSCLRDSGVVVGLFVLNLYRARLRAKSKFHAHIGWGHSGSAPRWRRTSRC
jgi:hypothetical protein